MNATAAERTARTATRRNREAAARARDLAEILRTRTYGHPHRDVLLILVGHLHTAAEAFENTAPLVMGGVTVTNVIPADAGMPLMECQMVAGDHPQAGIAEAVFAYITAPFGRRTPGLDPLGAKSPQLARQDAELRTQIALAEHQLTTEGDPTTRYALLATLVNLHRKFIRLGAIVATDNARPCNR
ncbi:hypothetical protein ACWEFD_17980 [Streptomyces ardesiacus]